MTNYEKYEAKQKELKKQFSKEYLKVWLFFFAYNIVADIAIYFLREILTEPIAVVAVLVSTGISFFITLKAVVDLKHIKTEQENKLMQDAPLGKIKM